VSQPTTCGDVVKAKNDGVDKTIRSRRAPQANGGYLHSRPEAAVRTSPSPARTALYQNANRMTPSIAHREAATKTAYQRFARSHDGHRPSARRRHEAAIPLRNSDIPTQREPPLHPRRRRHEPT